MEIWLPWLSKMPPEYALLAFLVVSFMTLVTTIWTGAQQQVLKAYDSRIATLEAALKAATKATETERRLRQVCEDARKALKRVVDELRVELDIVKRQLANERRKITTLEERLKHHEEAA